MIKIYGYRLSPYVERVYQQVHSKGVEAEFEFLPIPDGDLKSAEYTAMNPFGKMPVLVDGDLNIPESAIICEYIEGKFTDTPLTPLDKDERLAINLIMRLLDIYIFPNMFAATTEMRAEKVDKVRVAARFAEVNTALDMIEKFAVTTGSGHLVGNQWSLADCALVPADFFFTSIMVPAGFDVYENRPNMKAWHEAQQYTPRMTEAHKTMAKELVAFMQRMKEQ